VRKEGKSKKSKVTILNGVARNRKNSKNRRSRGVTRTAEREKTTRKMKQPFAERTHHSKVKPKKRWPRSHSVSRHMVGEGEEQERKPGRYQKGEGGGLPVGSYKN